MTMSYLVVFGIVILYLLSVVNVLREYERGVIFRLGRLLPKSKGPGLILVFWPIDRMERISLRLVTMDVPSQDVITRDNVSVKVNAIVYFRVVEPNSAVVSVENFLYATSQLSSDHFEIGPGTGRTGRSSEQARGTQRKTADDSGSAHRPLGDQGDHGRDQDRRPAF